MPAKTFDDFQKRFDEWTLDILTDDAKMQAWVKKSQAINRLNASGLLLDEEIQKISDKVEKDKRLDELFGVE